MDNIKGYQRVSLIGRGILIFGILVLLFQFIRFENIRVILDSLADDGSVDFFNIEVFILLKNIAFWFSLILITIGILTWRFHPQIFLSLNSINIRGKTIITQFITDFNDMRVNFLSLIREKNVKLTLLIIVLFGAFLRIVFILTPIRYDEAYTFTVFAIKPFSFIMSDYHVPNNHILHSIFVRISFLLLGSELWVIRLPVFISGILLIIATYLLGRILYNKTTGFISSGLVAGSSLLIEYSTNARGYMLVTLLFVILILGALVVKSKTNYAAWAIITIASISGMYTIPIFVYPLGMVYTWLFVSFLIKDVGKGRNSKQFILHLVLSGVVITIIVFILYLPVINSSGIDALIGNKYVESVEESQFIGNIPARIRATWQDWNRGISTPISWISFAGFLASTIFSFRLFGHKFPFPLAAIIWVTIILTIQKVTPWPRVWIFFLPIYLTYATIGLMWLLNLVFSRITFVRKFYAERIKIGLTFVIIFLVGFTSLMSAPMVNIKRIYEGGKSEEEFVAEYLKSNLKENDTIVAIIPINYPLRYYLFNEDVPKNFLYQKAMKSTFQRAWVVVNTEVNQTLPDVIRTAKLDDILSDKNAINAYQVNTTTVYKIAR